MNIAIMSSIPATLARIFVERHFSTLKKCHIHVRVIIIDENTTRKNSFLNHALKVAPKIRETLHAEMLSFANCEV